MQAYKINLTDKDTVVFINGFKALNFKGFVWLWINLYAIVKSVKKHNGCYESFACLVSPFQVLMITYWHNELEKKNYFKSDKHSRFMNFLLKNPSALALFNETYYPTQAGLYINSKQGLAKK